MISDETIRAMLEAVNVDEEDIIQYGENEKRLEEFVDKIGEPDEIMTQRYLKPLKRGASLIHRYHYNDPDTGQYMTIYWVEEEGEDIGAEGRLIRMRAMLQTICEGAWVKRHGAKYEEQEPPCAS